MSNLHVVNSASQSVGDSRAERNGVKVSEKLPQHEAQTPRVVKAPQVLIVDSDINSLSLLAQLVAKEGFITYTATSLAEAQKCISRRCPELILLDLTLPESDGRDLLKVFSAHQKGKHPQIVVISDSSREAVNQHAQPITGYLVKPIQLPDLRRVLDNASGTSGAERESLNFRDDVRKPDRFGKLMGSSRAMQRVYDQIERVAPTCASVLLTGESGTGKEVVAQTIHELSSRRGAPFLPVNCGAISPQLIESELFGHEKGSFTGAVRDHRGFFERANGGTLFLDEITEMPVELQVKLLRVLETRFFARVGSDRELETDVRIVAATNRTPEDAVKEGFLREDLLYRLQVFPIHLPPVRDRGEDIGLLASYFLAELNRKERASKRFSEAAMEALERYHWPGNLRELKNVVYRAFIMADDVIEGTHFPGEIINDEKIVGPSFTVRVGSSVAEVEKNLIMATLEQCEGKKEKAAEILGVSVKTLYNRLKDYEL
ncbi:MAG: sigma-54-dependent Fis family transcriptional regulator [Alteromonadaceae bacterium]|nr:sigma-54-dependent Fis family transcriptional regulator [Alteromonadaceae bacterium]|tara:strand:- start:4171 stop:5637 length:1467 start_codon:yes stop_codon:yes gene_type:complete